MQECVSLTAYCDVSVAALLEHVTATSMTRVNVSLLVWAHLSGFAHHTKRSHWCFSCSHQLAVSPLSSQSVHTCSTGSTYTWWALRSELKTGRVFLTNRLWLSSLLKCFYFFSKCHDPHEKYPSTHLLLILYRFMAGLEPVPAAKRRGLPGQVTSLLQG